MSAYIEALANAYLLAPECSEDEDRLRELLERNVPDEQARDELLEQLSVKL